MEMILGLVVMAGVPAYLVVQPATIFALARRLAPGCAGAAAPDRARPVFQPVRAVPRI